MVTVVQLVRASDCGSECRGFESHRSPFFKSLTTSRCEGFFLSIYLLPLSLLSARPPNRGATSLRSLPTPGALPFPVSRPCCRRCACRTVALDRISAARLLAHSHTCPNARGCRKRFAPLHRRMRSGANRLLGWGRDAPAPMRFSKRLSGVVETYISSRAGARAHTAFFVFCLHPSPACVRRSKSNRCGEGKGEGLCSPLPSPLCGSRLDCCGFWHKGRHVFDQSPLLFPHFRAVFPVRIE